MKSPTPTTNPAEFSSYPNYLAARVDGPRAARELSRTGTIGRPRGRATRSTMARTEVLGSVHEAYNPLRDRRPSGARRSERHSSSDDNKNSDGSYGSQRIRTPGRNPQLDRRPWGRGEAAATWPGCERRGRGGDRESADLRTECASRKRMPGRGKGFPGKSPWICYAWPVWGNITRI